MASHSEKRKQIIAQTRKDVKKESERKDIQIIHAIRSLDTIDKTSNLLFEQVKSWRNDKTDPDIVDGFEDSVVNLKKEREKLNEHIKRLMKTECPNLNEVAGTLVGARLIALAGSLKRLSEFPASTIQVLGAEKALFAHLSGTATSPKYGAIFAVPQVRNTPKHKRGKVARKLASKISLAAKVDYFKGEFIGDRLIKEFNEEINRLA